MPRERTMTPMPKRHPPSLRHLRVDLMGWEAEVSVKATAQERHR